MLKRTGSSYLNYRFGFTAVDQNVVSNEAYSSNDGYDGAQVSCDAIVGGYFHDDFIRPNNAEGDAQFLTKWTFDGADGGQFSVLYASGSVHCIELGTGTDGAERGWAWPTNIQDMSQVDIQLELYSNDISGFRRVGLMACGRGDRSAAFLYALIFGDEVGQTTGVGGAKLYKLENFDLDNLYDEADTLDNLEPVTVTLLDSFTPKTTVTNDGIAVVYRLNVQNENGDHIIRVYESSDGGAVYDVVASATESGDAPAGKPGLVSIGVDDSTGNARYLGREAFITRLDGTRSLFVKVLALARANMEDTR